MLYRFGPFELDRAKFELRADGLVVPIEPQVFALLALLVENRERMVSRDELIEKIWDGRVVSDAAVASRVKSARAAIGDDGRAQRCIRTIHGQGFRFVAELKVDPSPAQVGHVAASGPAETTSESGAMAATGRPSIAVLPFRLLGDAGRYAAVADALPHELIVELARLRWLFVTARGSSFRLRDLQPDFASVANLLGVRYCLSGTVEIAQPRLAVTVELADTRDGRVVWAERYDGTLDDVHHFRTEIVGRILAALEIRIPLHEASLARLAVSEDLDAWSAYHLALQHVYYFNRRDNAAAAELFRRAATLDPGFARAQAGLSFVHFQNAFLHRCDDLAREIALARSHALRGLELDPQDPFVLFTLGRSYWLEGDLDTALGWLQRATELSPNYAQGIYARAWTEALAGDGAAGREHVDLAMQLSPIDPLLYGMLGTRAFTHIARGEDREAASFGERAARSPGAHVLIAMIAAAAHGLAGDQARAAHWAANARTRNPALTRADFLRAFPIRSEAMRGRVTGALARVGY